MGEGAPAAGKVAGRLPSGRDLQGSLNAPSLRDQALPAADAVSIIKYRYGYILVVFMISSATSSIDLPVVSIVRSVIPGISG